MSQLTAWRVSRMQPREKEPKSFSGALSGRGEAESSRWPRQLYGRGLTYTERQLQRSRGPSAEYRLAHVCEETTDN